MTPRSLAVLLAEPISFWTTDELSYYLTNPPMDKLPTPVTVKWSDLAIELLDEFVYRYRRIERQQTFDLCEDAIRRLK